MSRLSSTFPGTTACPESPPVRMPSRVSSSSPPFTFVRLGGMALVALLREHRPDALLEKLSLSRGQRRSGFRCGIRSDCSGERVEPGEGGNEAKAEK